MNQTAVASTFNPRNGAITADFRVLSAQSLAEAGLDVGGKVDGVRRRAGLAPHRVGTPDAVKVAGQHVALEGEGDELIVAGFSAGTATEGTATVHYQDGTSEQVRTPPPAVERRVDGCRRHGAARQRGVASAAHQAVSGGTISTVTAPASVFAQRIPLSGKPVASVTLPDGSPVTGEGLSLFAVELAGSAVPTGATVLTECRGPFAWVHVTVANEHDARIAVMVDTVLGDDVKVNLDPGKETRSSFKMPGALTDGEAVVVATGGDGARTTTTVPYTGIDCR